MLSSLTKAASATESDNNSEQPEWRNDEDDEHIKQCKEFLKDEGFKVVSKGGFGTMIFMSIVGGICILFILGYGIYQCLENQCNDM